MRAWHTGLQHLQHWKGTATVADLICVVIPTSSEKTYMLVGCLWPLIQTSGFFFPPSCLAAVYLAAAVCPFGLVDSLFRGEINCGCAVWQVGFCWFQSSNKALKTKVCLMLGLTARSCFESPAVLTTLSLSYCWCWERTWRSLSAFQVQKNVLRKREKNGCTRRLYETNMTPCISVQSANTGNWPTFGVVIPVVLHENVAFGNRTTSHKWSTRGAVMRMEPDTHHGNHSRTSKTFCDRNCGLKRGNTEEPKPSPRKIRGIFRGKN